MYGVEIGTFNLSYQVDCDNLLYLGVGYLVKGECKGLAWGLKRFMPKN